MAKAKSKKKKKTDIEAPKAKRMTKEEKLLWRRQNRAKLKAEKVEEAAKDSPKEEEPVKPEPEPEPEPETEEED